MTQEETRDPQRLIERGKHTRFNSESGRVAGLKSKKAHAERRKLREEVILMLESLMKENGKVRLSPIDGEPLTYGRGVLYAQLKRALSGDARSATLLLQLAGELVEKHEIQTTQDIDVAWDDFLKQLK